MTRALFTGTFDPPTLGHVDVIRRAAGLFDEVLVGVAVNMEKSPVLSSDERVSLLETVTAELQAVSVRSFDGLVVDFARESGCHVLIRGLRTVTDFEYEYAMAMANRRLGGLETFFLIPSEEYAFISSRLIREAASFGGDVSSFLPAEVNAAFVPKLRSKDKTT